MSDPQMGLARRSGRTTPVVRAMVGAAILCVVVLAAVTFSAGGASPSASPSAAPQTPGVTSSPAIGLTADSYSCGGTTVLAATIPTAPPSASASISGLVASNTAPANASASGPGDPLVTLAGVVSRYPSILPAVGWTPQGGSSKNIVYVASNNKTPAPFAFVDLGLVGEKWVANAYGDCEPVLGSGAGSSLSTIPWNVAGSLGKAATTLNILFQSNLCGESFVGTTVWYGQTRVTVTLWARATTANSGSCPSAPEMAHFAVVLAEGIGSRQLLIGPSSAVRPAESAPAPVLS